jgi:hypothetical protein
LIEILRNYLWVFSCLRSCLLEEQRGGFERLVRQFFEDVMFLKEELEVLDCLEPVFKDEDHTAHVIVPQDVVVQFK